MTGDAVGLITKVLREALIAVHPFGANAGGKYPAWFQEWIDLAAPEAAEAVDAALGGLTRDYSTGVGGEGFPYLKSRWAGSWTTEEPS